MQELSESDAAAPSRTSVSSRVALAAFAVGAAVAVPLRLAAARHAWFTVDDWDFLAVRTGGNLGDLFRPHYEHWSTMIVVAYRLLWWLAGLRYLPYALFAIGLYLGVAALIRVVMRRAGVGPWVATLAALALVYLGVGVENSFFTAAMVFGLTHLVLADHDGPITRRDSLALGAGLIGLMCSGLAVTMTFVVGTAMLLRRGWRIALFHTVPLAVVYVTWLALAPTGQSGAAFHARTPGNVIRFVVAGLRAGFSRTGQWPGFGFVAAALLLAGLYLIWTQQGVAIVHGRLAAPIALFAGAVAFLVLTGAVRSGQGVQGFLKGVGPEHARAGRYAYVVAAMLVPVLAVAVDVIIRRWPSVAVVLVALLVVSVPSRVHQFNVEGRAFAAPGVFSKQLVLSAPRLPLAHQLPRTVNVSILHGGGPSLGWLLDSFPSGRIPAPPSFTPDDVANATSVLALGRSSTRVGARCAALDEPTVRVLPRGGMLTLQRGNATVTYLPDGGGESAAAPFPAPTLVALAGPLRLRLAPAAHFAGHTVVCG